MRFQYILAFILIFVSKLILAQAPVSNFTTDDGQWAGCSPYQVHFIDQSTNAVSWSWTLGNGNTSTQQNPSDVFATPGQYTVTLTVTSGSGLTNSSTHTITVYSNPQINFSISSTISCVPFTVNLTDLSIQGDGIIDTWNWDFGEGSSSNLQNPSFTYSQPAEYNILLNVFDEHGCTDTAVVKTIIATEAPEIIISADEVFSCEPPLDVQFVNNSTAYGDISYSWNLGNGNTSTEINPSTTYDVIGQYDVSFSMTDENGCVADTIMTNYINVTNVVADFDAIDTVCYNVETEFVNTSIGGMTYLWNFGDGVTSTQENPSHTYTSSGEYEVSLISTESFSCKDTIKKIIYVEQAIASFTYTPAYWCQAPVDVEFTDASTSNVTSWNYSFGDGGISNTEDVTHEYLSGGVYFPLLLVETDHGCKDTAAGIISIVPFGVSVSFDNTRDCLPLPVNFTETNSSEQPIVSWLWDFGDGYTDTTATPTHVYNEAGDFVAYVTVENSIGCQSTSFPVTIEVGDSLIPNALIVPKDTCAIAQFTYTDISDSLHLVDEWWWSFGEGEGTGSTQEATHLYSDTTGHFDIQFVIGYNGCYSDTLEDTVLVLGPIVKLDVAMECDSPFVYTFTLDITDATDFTLDFGDGIDTSFTFIDDTSMVFDIVHVYDSLLRGSDLTPTLVAHNDTVNLPDGCDYDASVTVHIRDIIADFTISDTLPCNYDTIQFTSISQDASSFYWQAVNHNTGLSNLIYNGVSSSANYTFNTNAYFDINFIATDINGCKDTISRWLKTYRPIVDFATDSLIGCQPLLLNFYDNTASDTALINWAWNFGNGTIISGDEDTVANTFSGIQNYTINLVVTDTLGCTNQKSLTITSTKPKPSFSISDLQLCAGDSVSFDNTSTGHGTLSYEWYFDDGDTSFIGEPYHTYIDSGYFHVSLLAIDDIGCDSLITHTDSIHVQAIPEAAFTVDTTAWDCYVPAHSFSFTDTTESVYLVSYLWYFGDGASSSVHNPTHTYALPGEYSVSLYVESNYGCKDTTLKTQYVKVKGPLGVATFDPIVCRGDSVSYTISDTSDVYSYDWYFGDGNNLLDCQVNPAYHIYDTDSIKNVTLMLHSDTLGTCDVPIQAPLYIHELIADFTGNLDNKCIGQHLIDVNDNSSSAQDEVVSWNWSFGNGTISVLQNPTIFSYSEVDTFDIALIVQNEFGCHDTAIKPVVVYPLPIVSAHEDTLICLGDNVQLWATGGVEYLWFPDYNLDNNNISNAIATPEIDTLYTVKITDENDCYAFEDVQIYVQQPVNLELNVNYAGQEVLGDEVTIILGDTIYFYAITADTALITWAPNQSISCTDCPNPHANPYDDIDYVVTITDPNQCNFDVSGSIKIYVTEATLDVPSAFTPNGDGNNDVIYAKGWGLKSLQEFKIFNRWGQLLWETTDINEGWDGTYNGELQNIDTYVYLVKGIAYNGEELTKKGYINLMQ